MPIYAGSFRNYKHYRTFWYMTHLVQRREGGGSEFPNFGPHCHPANGNEDDREWAAAWQNQQNGCAASEDSDQPGQPPSLIRVFAVRLKKAWVLSYSLSAQRRLIRLSAHSFCCFCYVVAQMMTKGWYLFGLVKVSSRKDPRSGLRHMSRDRSFQSCPGKEWIHVRVDPGKWKSDSFPHRWLYVIWRFDVNKIVLDLVEHGQGWNLPSFLWSRRKSWFEPRQANLCLRAFYHDKF